MATIQVGGGYRGNTSAGGVGMGAGVLLGTLRVGGGYRGNTSAGGVGMEAGVLLGTLRVGGGYRGNTSAGGVGLSAGVLGTLRVGGGYRGNTSAGGVGMGAGVLLLGTLQVGGGYRGNTSAGGVGLSAGVLVTGVGLRVGGMGIATTAGSAGVLVTGFGLSVGGMGIAPLSGALLQPVWSIGPRVTAQVLGLPFNHYVPNGSGPVIVPANLVNSTPVWVTGDPKLKAAKAISDKTCAGYAAFDPAIVSEGDYLLGDQDAAGPPTIFFVATVDLPHPIEVILCNQVVNLVRLTTRLTGGDTRTPLATEWPGALIHGGGRAGKPPEELPDLAMMGGFTLLLPSSLPAQPKAGDIIEDGEYSPNEYTVQGVQHGPRGWVIFLSGN